MEQADYHFQQHRFLTDKNIRKFDVAELQELLDSIATFYQMVVSINLSKNNYHLMEFETEGAFSQVPIFGRLDEFMKVTSKEILAGDLPGFAQKLSRETLIQAHHQGEKNIRHYFRCRDGEKYRWVECNVILYTNEQGDACAFTMQRWSDERVDELEKMWMQKVLDLAVLSSFEYIGLVNLSTGEYMIHGSKENTHGIPERGDYDKIVEMIRDSIISAEERESYYETMKLETVAARMQEKGMYLCKYSIVNDGIRNVSFQWFEPTQTQVLMIVQRSS